MIPIFFLVLIIEFSSIYCNGLIWFAVPTVLKIDSLTILIVISILINFLTGFLISLLKQNIFSAASIKYLVAIISCSVLIIVSFLIGIGNFTIINSLTTFFQKIWIHIFHVRKDPIGILTIGIINFSIMFFVTPISFFVGNYLLVKNHK